MLPHYRLFDMTAVNAPRRALRPMFRKDDRCRWNNLNPGVTEAVNVVVSVGLMALNAGTH